jgi:hypothetical protein
MTRGTPLVLVLLALPALWGCGDGRGSPLAATGNRPPTVTVSNNGSCHPRPGRSCTVSFNAVAQDPDGDPLRLAWAGCASGRGPVATCTVSSPGLVTASVLVDDGRGGLATVSATAEGTNAPPVVYIGFGPGGQPIPVPDPAASNRTYTVEGTEPVDPEGDEEPNRLCTRAGLVVTGPCRATLFACGGVGNVFDIDIHTLQGPGTCLVEARVPDPWGAVGTARLAFAVTP